MPQVSSVSYILPDDVDEDLESRPIKYKCITQVWEGQLMLQVTELRLKKNFNPVNQINQIEILKDKILKILLHRCTGET